MVPVADPLDPVTPRTQTEDAVATCESPQTPPCPYLFPARLSVFYHQGSVLSLVELLQVESDLRHACVVD